MIKLSKSFVGQSELDTMAQVIEGSYLGMGQFTREFEQKLSDYLTNQVITTSSGTAALQLALQASGVGVGDYVLVPALTYVATFQAITATGALPIFCDVDSEALVIDLESIPKSFAKRAKALIIVHYAGYAASLEPFLEFCRENDLRLIEDAAHAYGSRYNSTQKPRVGSHKESICCFSFDGIKNITAGEGGCVSTSNIAIADYIRDARLLGVVKDTDKRFNSERSWNFDIETQGWRYHLSNIMAAIGLAQFDKQDSLFLARQQLSLQYLEILDSVSEICQPFFSGKQLSYSVPHIFPVILALELDRDKLRSRLLDRNIETGVHYVLGHQLSFFKSCLRTDLSVAENYSRRLLSLPLHPGLSGSDIQMVAQAFVEEARTLC